MIAFPQQAEQEYTREETMQKAQENRLKGFLKRPFLKMDRKPEEEKMAPMKAVCGKRYFLVDFENVGPDGIENAGRLSSSDFVHLFCTKNSGKICPSVLAGFNSTNLFVHVVPQGSQSVDMHIVSFLGNLIGDKDNRGEYIIVSRDTDYDNVIHFWQTERKAAVKRQEKLIETGRAKQGEAKPASAQMTEKKAGGTAGKKAAKKQEASAAQGSTKAPEAKMQQKAAKKQEAPEAKVSAKVPEAKMQQKAVKKQEAPAAQGSAKAPEAKTQQKAVKKQEAPAAQGSAKNLSAKAEQKAVSQQKTAQEQKPAGQTKEAASKAEKNRIAKEKVKLNSAVMKALSKAKYDNSVIGFVSSQAAKHYSDANRKQVMHGVIVQKYGQEKGLEIYKKIREFL